MMIASTGSFLSGLSNTKKGIMALLGAVVLGFAIGTSAVTQIGLPQRVQVLEEGMDNLGDRVGHLESDDARATTERDFIIRVLGWTTCAIEASSDGNNIHERCGEAPQFSFGRQ